MIFKNNNEHQLKPIQKEKNNNDKISALCANSTGLWVEIKTVFSTNEMYRTSSTFLYAVSTV